MQNPSKKTNTSKKPKKTKNMKRPSKKSGKKKKRSSASTKKKGVTKKPKRNLSSYDMAKLYLDKSVAVNAEVFHRRAQSNDLRKIIAANFVAQGLDLKDEVHKKALTDATREHVAKRFAEIKTNNTPEYQEFVKREAAGAVRAKMLLAKAPVDPRYNTAVDFVEHVYPKKVWAKESTAEKRVLKNLYNAYIAECDADNAKYQTFLSEHKVKIVLVRVKKAKCKSTFEMAKLYITKNVDIGRRSLHRRANNMRIRREIFPKLKLENPSMSVKDLNSLAFRESSRLVTDRFIDIETRNTEEYQGYVRQEGLNKADAKLLLDNTPRGKPRNTAFNYFKSACYKDSDRLSKEHNLVIPKDKFVGPKSNLNTGKMAALVNLWNVMSAGEKAEYTIAFKANNAKCESDDKEYLEFLATRGITKMDIVSPAKREKDLKAKKLEDLRKKNIALKEKAAKKKKIIDDRVKKAKDKVAARKAAKKKKKTTSKKKKKPATKKKKTKRKRSSDDDAGTSAKRAGKNKKD